MIAFFLFSTCMFIDYQHHRYDLISIVIVLIFCLRRLSQTLLYLLSMTFYLLLCNYYPYPDYKISCNVKQDIFQIDIFKQQKTNFNIFIQN